MRKLQKCKLRPEELMGERTEEKMNRINRFHKSLTTSLRKNKGNVVTHPCGITRWYNFQIPAEVRSHAAKQKSSDSEKSLIILPMCG